MRGSDQSLETRGDPVAFSAGGNLQTAADQERAQFSFHCARADARNRKSLRVRTEGAP